MFSSHSLPFSLTNVITFLGILLEFIYVYKAKNKFCNYKVAFYAHFFTLCLIFSSNLSWRWLYMESFLVFS